MANKVTAKHILVDKKTLAEDIIEEINTGGIKFEEAAKKYSTCPSRKKGGNLGEFGRGQMVKEFEKAAFNLQKGQMTQQPIKTKFGYHIIKALSNPKKEVKSLDKVKDEIRRTLLGDKREKKLKSLREGLEIQVLWDCMG